MTSQEWQRGYDEARRDIANRISAAWDEQCSGYRNGDVCESCRAYGDALDLALEAKP